MSASNHVIAIGAGMIGIVGAVSMILFEHFKQEKRSRMMAQNLSRMDAQLSVLKAELEQIRISQSFRRSNASQGKRSTAPSSSRTAFARSPSADDLRSLSDIDTSDLEYFDVTDDEYGDVGPKQPLQMALLDVDQRLRDGDVEVIAETLTILDNLCAEYPDSPELWYRLAKCCHHAAKRAVTPRTKRDNIAKGASACLRALDYDYDNAEHHKLYATLVGLRCDYEPTKQRITDGYLFKEHVDIAIRLNPTDAMLHHMLGRFKYEISGLNWFERKVATALFGEPPSGTYTEALTCFLEAERLTVIEWKENKMYVGKCYIALGEVRRGVDWLQQAQDVTSESQLEELNVNTEIGQLLSKYHVYR